MNEPMIRNMDTKSLVKVCEDHLFSGDELPQYVLAELLNRLEQMQAELSELKER